MCCFNKVNLSAILLVHKRITNFMSNNYFSKIYFFVSFSNVVESDGPQMKT